MKRWITAVAIALIASLGATGCGTFSRLGGLFGNIFTLNHNNDYAQAHERYDREAIAYSAARHKILDANETRILGAVTDAQFREYLALELNVSGDDDKSNTDAGNLVVGANEFVIKDLEKWALTGSKPADFDAHAATLRDAQEKLIAFVRTVKP